MSATTTDALARAEADKALVRGFVDALNRGDGEAIENALTEDATWFLFSTLPTSGLYEGRDAIMRDFFAAGLSLYEPGTLHLEITGIVAGDSHVTLEWRATAKAATGRDYDNLYCLVMEMRDGRIAAVRHYPDTLTASKVLWD